MRVWGRDFTPNSRLIGLYNNQSQTEKPKSIELSWNIDGELIKEYEETYDEYSHTTVDVLNAKQDYATFIRSYGNTYQEKHDYNSINLVGLKNTTIKSNGLTAQVKGQQIYLSGTMEDVYTIIALPMETTFNLDIGDEYWGAYTASSDLSGFNLRFNLTGSEGVLMKTPNKQSLVEKQTVSLGGTPKSVYLIIISETATTIPDNTVINLQFSSMSFNISDMRTFYQKTPTVDSFSKIYNVGDEYNGKYYLNPSTSQNNLIEVMSDGGQNIKYTFDPDKSKYTMSPTALNKDSYLKLRIKNRMAYNYPYYISYKTTGNILGSKLYAIDIINSTIQNEITITDGRFVAPLTGNDIQLEIQLDSSSLNNTCTLDELQITLFKEETYSEPIGNTSSLSLDEPLRSMPNNQYRDIMAIENLNVLNPNIQGGDIKPFEDYMVVTNGLNAYLWFYDVSGNLLNPSSPLPLPSNGTLIRTARNAVKFTMTHNNTNPALADITPSEITSSHTALVYYKNMPVSSQILYYPYVDSPSVVRQIKRAVFTSETLPNFIYSIGNNYVEFMMDLFDANNNVPDTTLLVQSNYFKGIDINSFRETTDINLITIGNLCTIFRFPRKSKFMEDIAIGDITENFKAWIQQKEDEGEPFYIDYVVEEPIVEPLGNSQIETLSKAITFTERTFALMENKVRGTVSIKYVRNYDTSQINGVYVKLDVENGLGQTQSKNSNEIAYPLNTDKIFIWLRKKGNNYDIRIENLGQFEDTSPIQIHNVINTTPASNNPAGINFISVENGIYDRINITSDVDFPYNPNFPSGWDKKTILNANFNGNANAGNVKYVLSEINAIKIKRRLKGTFNWITLYNIPVNKIEDITFSKLDYLARSSTEYEYALVLIIGNAEAEYMITEAEADFYGIFITDGKTTYKFKAGTSYSGNERVHPTGTYQPYGGKYPIVVSNGNINYDKGTVTGSIIVPDEQEQINRLATVNKIKEINNFLSSPSSKVLKDWNGNIWLVALTDNFPLSYNSEIGMGFASVSFNWVEIGDANNGNDLFNNNLIYADN